MAATTTIRRQDMHEASYSSPVTASSPSLSSSLEVTNVPDSLSSMSYLPDRRIIAVAGSKQAYFVSAREVGGGVTLAKAGTIGNFRPEHLAWQPNNSTILAASDRGGPLMIFDVVLMEKTQCNAGEWCLKQENKIAWLTSKHRALSSIAWNLHQPHVIACSSPDFALGMWDTRTASNGAGGGGEFRYGVDHQGNDISFSPYHPHLVAVAAQSSNTGTLMLFDQRNLSVSLTHQNTPGFCTAVAFHPQFADVCSYSYKLYGNKRDAKIEYLNVTVNHSGGSPPPPPPPNDGVCVARNNNGNPECWVSISHHSALPSIVCIAPQSRLRWRPVASNMKFLSPLWFAACASSLDTDVNVWDALNPYTPVLAARNLHLGEDRKSQVIADLLWLNSSTLVTCGKNSKSLVVSTIHNAGMWSHHQELPTASVGMGTFGNLVVVRDKPSLRDLYEADMASNTHQAETLSERSPTTAYSPQINSKNSTAMPLYPPQPSTPNSAAASSTKPPQLGGTAVAAPVTASVMRTSPPPSQSLPPQQPQKGEKKESLFAKIFGSKDKDKEKEKTAVTSSSSIFTPSTQTVGSSGSGGGGGGGSGTAPPTPKLAAAVPPPMPFACATMTLSPSGRQLFPAVMELPPLLLAQEIDSFKHLQPTMPKAVLESFRLDPCSLEYANYASRTTKKQFRGLAKEWDSRYEHCVLHRRTEELELDDVIVCPESRQNLDNVDDAVSDVCMSNAAVCTRIGLSAKDPRYCLWKSIALTLKLHNPAFVLSQVAHVLSFASLNGDVQFATMLYITIVLWWRNRAHVSSRGVVPTEACMLLCPEWKDRAFQWVDAYATRLANAELWVEWSELEYVFPYTVRTTASKPECFENPCFKVEFLSHEKAIMFVHCGSCEHVVKDTATNNTTSEQRGGQPQVQPHRRKPAQAFCSHSSCRHKPLHTCIICEQVVEGTFVWMKTCGHGGHADHIAEWIAENDECPKCGVSVIA